MISRKYYFVARFSRERDDEQSQLRIQREGEVVHLVAHRLSDLSAELASVGDRDARFPLPHGRGDEFHHGAPAPDPRGLPKGPRPHDINDPYLNLEAINEDAGFQVRMLHRLVIRLR